MPSYEGMSIDERAGRRNCKAIVVSRRATDEQGVGFAII